MKRILGAAAVLACALVALTSAQQPQPTPPRAALQIKVLEGEDAVNIVAQKTAVRPVVEVRDRNDLPVAGATVQFTLLLQAGGAGTATFPNGQALVTVTTDALGRAAAPQLQSVAPGAVRINVQATYQGQVATATVQQTNYATVADATSAGRTPSTESAANASSGAATGAAGTIAGIAAAGASGAFLVKETVTSSCDSSSNTFTADLAAAVDACSGATGGACTSAGQRAADSLGEWCSCDGKDNVVTSLAVIGTSFSQLASGASFAGVQIPNSCR